MPVKQIIVIQCDACPDELRPYTGQFCYELPQGVILCKGCFQHTQRILRLFNLVEEEQQLNTNSRRRKPTDILDDFYQQAEQEG